MTETIRLADIVFDKNIYPRKNHSPALVQKYSTCLEQIESAGNYIIVSRDNRLADGRHRHLAYLTVYGSDSDKTIPVSIVDFKDDDELFNFAVERNNSHGDQLSAEDKRRAAVKMYSRANRMSQEDISKALSVGHTTVNSWLKSTIDRERKDREEKIWDLWLTCHTQEEIAAVVGMSKQSICEFLQKSSGKSRQEDSELFRDFCPQIYKIWNFSKSTNEVKHFGNVPDGILDNLLYYFTNPMDIVFDPFAGGGMSLDVCAKRMRRCYASDLTPIPARQGSIRKWDITTGLPTDLGVPDFVFLDPPYWKQAAGEYSDKPTDLANISLESFIDTIADIAGQLKRKWNGSRPNAKLALLLGECKENGKYIDLPFKCYERICKKLTPVNRFQVPYSTQVHGGAYVQNAKDNKECLYLSRDLMVFGNE